MPHLTRQQRRKKTRVFNKNVIQEGGRHARKKNDERKLKKRF